MTDPDRTPDAIRDLEELFGPVISRYTRADAIRDGALIDVTELAKSYGFTTSVAMTIEAHVDLVAWDATADKRTGFTGQDETGRAWDVLTMAKHAIRTRRRPQADRLTFTLLRIPTAGRGTKPRLATAVVHIGGDDTGAPCLTIMLPHES